MAIRRATSPSRCHGLRRLPVPAGRLARPSPTGQPGPDAGSVHAGLGEVVDATDAGGEPGCRSTRSAGLNLPAERVLQWCWHRLATHA